MFRARQTRARVRLELALPPAEIEDGVSERLGGALRRYCSHRITYNDRERRATWLGGLSSLWIGIPIAVIGYLLVIYAGALVGPSGNVNLVAPTTGWVLVWVGFWFPQDTILFTPLGYGRPSFWPGSPQWSGAASIRGPHAFQARALPTELPDRVTRLDRRGGWSDAGGGPDGI